MGAYTATESARRVAFNLQQISANGLKRADEWPMSHGVRAKDENKVAARNTGERVR